MKSISSAITVAKPSASTHLDHLLAALIVKRLDTSNHLVDLSDSRMNQHAKSLRMLRTKEGEQMLAKSRTANHTVYICFERGGVMV